MMSLLNPSKLGYATLHYALILGILLLTIADSKGQITFQQTFQAPYMNGGTYVEITDDNGFIVTGQHQSSGAGGCDIYIFRRDECGNLVWFNTYGGGADDGGMCIRPTPDGGFVVTGLSQTGAGNYDSFILKIDGLGVAQWFNNYGGGGDDRGLQVQQTADGGYIMSGHTSSFGAGGWDAYLIKTDAVGTMQWSKTYGGGGTDFGNYVEQTPDGGYIIMGSTNSFGSGGYDMWMIKTDALGNLQWNRTYGGPGNEGEHWHTKGLIASDGGYIISSYTSSYGAGSNDLIMIKTDTTGVVQWSRTYGGTGDDQHRFIRETADNGFIMTGYSTSFGFGGNDYYLLKTDNNGILDWSYVYGGGGEEKAMCVQQASDGGYVMAGNATSFAPPGPGDLYDAYIVKTDSIGILGCNQDTAMTIVNSVTPSVTVPVPTVGTGATVTAVTPTVIPYTPAPQVLCLDCDVSFANFKYCENGLTVNYIDSSICATGWYWDFGDGSSDTTQNPVHTYAFPGTYNAQLIAQNVAYGCDDTMNITLVLDTHQVAYFTPTNVCDGDSVYFIDQSDTAGVTIIAYFWMFGDGDTSVAQNPTHLYAAPGTYQVSMVVTLSKDNCTDTVTKLITIYPRPVPNFSSDTACALSSTQFIDSSQVLSGGVVAWTWDFGDGGFDSVANPTHTYTLGGIYLAELTATSDKGCADSITLPVKVHYTPAPLFNTPPVCFGTPSPFTDLSTIAGDTIVAWSWNFGDTGSSSLASPNYTYAMANIYSATLTLTSNQGCVNAITSTVIVNPMPVPIFTAPNTCLYDTVYFVDQSTIQSGAIINWLWDFDDGNTSTLTSTDHLYSNYGTYNISLTLTSDSGCIEVLDTILDIHAVPSANFSVPNVCAYDSAHFTDLSTIPSGNVSQWSWFFGDGYLSTEQNPVHFYGYSDFFDVMMIAISDSGCVDTISQTFEVYNVPEADFEYTIVCLNDSPTVFTDSSKIVGDVIVAWAWDFGDTTYSNLQYPTHAFQDSGNFLVQFVATSLNGCNDTIVKSVLVRSLPNLAFDLDTAIGCAPWPIAFTNQSTNSIQFEWGFGDGATGINDDEYYIYQDAGYAASYTVYLAGLTAPGCRDTLFKIDTVSILPNPIAEYITVPNPATLLNPYITFTNISAGNLDTPTVHMWDYGDGSNWTGFDTIHTYSHEDTGTYLVELIVENTHGCLDTFTSVIAIEDDFTLFVPTAFTPNGDGINDVFYPSGIAINNSNFIFHFYIFDRWGDLVFKSHDASDGWDGIANKGKKLAQEDVYVWMIEAEDISGNPGGKHQYMGHVTLIK